MKAACQLLEEIFKTRGRNDKIGLLESAKADVQLETSLKFLLQTAFDPYLHFGVGEIYDDNSYWGDSPDLELLQDLRDKLVTREITGNAAREEVNTTILCSDLMVRKWLVAAFSKNIKCGVATGSINKVFPGLIREFEVQLCDKLEKGQELPKGTWIAEPKYDGLRCFMLFKDNQLVEICSRNGKPLYNMDYIGIELAQHIKDGVVDGEAFAADWNESTGVVRSSKTERSSASLKFRAFDYIEQSEWNARRGALRLSVRRENLRSLIGDKVVHTVITDGVNIETAEEAWKLAKQYSQQGYEGAVIKNLDAPYGFKRTRDWLKLKFEDTTEVTVIDFQEGTGRNAGRLGAFICKTEDGIEVNVGGGFSDVQRTKFWERRNSLLGQTIEVKFQEQTKDGSLRFPVFVRIREDK